jgi:DNA-binding CsgD family transcriptional regulator
MPETRWPLAGRSKELEGARQAAAGRSSRQIAADVQLSVRTVESRLQKVYEKPGVCGRRELFGALDEAPAEREAG